MNEQIAQQILAEIKNINTEITGIKTEITGINTEITGIKTEITGIKSEITGIKTEISVMKSQLDENTQIVKVIRDRQEETDAKLESLTMDVHYLRGDLTALTDNVESIKNELEFTSHKTYVNEKEIFNLRREKFESKSN